MQKQNLVVGTFNRLGVLDGLELFRRSNANSKQLVILTYHERDGFRSTCSRRQPSIRSGVNQCIGIPVSRTD